MKKLILPLLLLVAFGMLAAVESDPSAVVGYVKYPCLLGNNLIGLPMDQAYTMQYELADDYPGMMNAMSYWDASITPQGWVTASDLGGFWDLDFAIGTETVLLVNATAGFNLYSIGDLPAANAAFDLVPGNNTLFVPLNRSDLSDSDLLGAAIGIVNAQSYWDATISPQGWVTASDLGGFWDITFSTPIGFPVLVNSTGTATWPARGATPTLSISK